MPRLNALTCNQMICLLALYRGNPEVDGDIGTRSDDLAHLRANRYIDEFGQLTEKGQWRVKSALKGRRRGYERAPLRYRIGD